MTYDTFLASLSISGWTVPNRSFAHREFGGGWQVCFVRLGGKFQQPGRIAFVICVRHSCMRNVERELNPIEKDPFSYPFKLTLRQIEEGLLTYHSTNLNYEHSELDVSADWQRVFSALEGAVPKWLSLQTPWTLKQQIVEHGEDAYIERIWLEDLADV
jgi:hypothetical protein